MSIKTFISKNLVVIVMVPVIVGGHYSWSKLQEMDNLVTPQEREKMQLAKIMKDAINLERVKAAFGLKSE